MKSYYSIILTLILLAGPSIYDSYSQVQNIITVQNTLIKYRDGIYEGQSRHTYTDEPYWGSIRITIENGLFTGINFMIRDSSLHETFTKKYKKHYKGNSVYIQQCKNDSKGVQIYPKRLMETQDISKIDVISGATWSYNIFRASAGEALKKAVK